MTRASPSSFRDPSGVVFQRDGVIYRQVNPVYRDHYRRLMDGGLYDELAEEGLLVAHEEADRSLALSEEAYRVLRPQPVPFISHPYEWSFGMLRDAALLTLDIQKRALRSGMILKDASAYNVQFRGKRPVFIDTLSFERYAQGKPWIAYRQFCEHFLAPLLLMSRLDVRLSGLLLTHIDGIPLELASRLLPRSSWIRPSIGFHVHLHARSIRRFIGRTPSERRGKRQRVSKSALNGLVDGLNRAVSRLQWSPDGTEWSDYESTHNYSAAERQAKEQIVDEILSELRPHTVWDLGSNTGAFSKIAARHADLVVSIDSDPAAVERNYESGSDSKIHPLCVDLTNPSPAIGWNNEERSALLDRGPADVALALALIHHLAISNNVPLDRIARFMRRVADRILIEWVPKDDPQVRRLLFSREDVFDDYRLEVFEGAFSSLFHILETREVSSTGRRLYWMKAS